MTEGIVGNVAPTEIVRFWTEAGRERWFTKDEGFDGDFRRRFEALHWAAARRELDHWAESAEGLLGLLILLDQFPRNCFRRTGHMYATDPLARMIARNAVERGLDQQVPETVRLFVYLPFAHSEDLADQQLSVRLQSALGAEQEGHARGHHDIIVRFGRFPHRNRILGRETTAEEAEFLSEGGFAG
ncbi:DUF924 family protein [Phreatobacter sp.]|uniref:DUF924 family protein n=1 Tax=Phreatobacter sp. TaxID=1966341 RepID=UPI003F6ED08A